MIIRSKEYSVADLLYKFARNSMSHDGLGSTQLKWSSSNIMDFFDFGSGHVRAVVPKDYLLGLILAIVTAPENVSLRGQGDGPVLRLKFLPGQEFPLSDLWGAEDYFYTVISSAMKGSIGRDSA